MNGLEDIGGSGQVARLFPVLADTSREGRTLSITMACLSQVPEFSKMFLKAVGKNTGVQTKVTAFTEVTFPGHDQGESRPDGLLVVKTGRTVWRAFIEAKIGTSKLTTDQVESYLKLAKGVGVDAVITISNEFVAQTHHHPTPVEKKHLKKVQLFHFSWFSLLTMMNVLSEGDQVADADHTFLLDELERFLVHPSAGLQRFTQMGASWTETFRRIRSGLPILKTSEETKDVVADWHAEMRDLCLFATRKTGARIDVKIPSRFKADMKGRTKADIDLLASKSVLCSTLVVPDAAAPINLEADLGTRTIRASMVVDAPKDKSQQTSRLNWLLRQLKDVDGDVVRVMSHWPGAAPVIESSLQEARDDATLHRHDNKALLPSRFTVLMRMAEGKKFVGRKTFIVSLEELTLSFYDTVLSRLRAWQPPAPKLGQAVEELAAPVSTD